MILAKFKSIDSEYQIFRELKGSFLEGKIERSVYNRRKRKLFPFIEEIRMKMVQKFNEFESYFVVNSMPLKVCKTSIFMAINCMPSVLLKVFFKVLTYLQLRLADKGCLSQRIQIDLFNEAWFQDKNLSENYNTNNHSVYQSICI